MEAEEETTIQKRSEIRKLVQASSFPHEEEVLQATINRAQREHFFSNLSIKEWNSLPEIMFDTHFFDQFNKRYNTHTKVPSRYAECKLQLNSRAGNPRYPFCINIFKYY